MGLEVVVVDMLEDLSALGQEVGQVNLLKGLLVVQLVEWDHQVVLAKFKDVLVHSEVCKLLKEMLRWHLDVLAASVRIDRLVGHSSLSQHLHACLLVIFFRWQVVQD